MAPIPNAVTPVKYLVKADIPSVGVYGNSLYDTFDEARDMAKFIATIFGDGLTDIERHATALEFHHVSGAVLPIAEVTTQYVFKCRRADATVTIDVVPSFPLPLSCQLN